MNGTIVDFKKKYSENTTDERSTSSCLLCLSGTVGLFTECFRDKPYTDERQQDIIGNFIFVHVKHSPVIQEHHII